MDSDKFGIAGFGGGRRSLGSNPAQQSPVLPATSVGQLPPAPGIPAPAGPQTAGAPSRRTRPSRQDPAGKKQSILQFEITKKKVKRQEVMQFSRQLAAFIRAGIPILEAIQTFADESGDKVFRRALTEIGTALRRGETFSQAASAQPAAFPRYYVDMLRAAELTGRLDNVLDQLAQYMERDLEARQKVRGAMIYPALIGLMSLVTVAILSVFVLPKFKTFFASLHAKLPLPTRMVLAASNFLAHWWWALGFGVVLVAGLLFAVLHTERGLRAKDWFLLRLPGVSGVVRYSIIERFCRVLGAMVVAGVPLPDAMVVTIESARNRMYQRALETVRAAMLEGQGIAGPIARTELFPAGITQMVRVGENTGTLDRQLETAATFYAKELDYKIKKLTTLFEPAMILLMGLVVGFVAVALVSAMYGIYNQVKLS